MYLICTDLDRTLIPNGPQPESPGVREIFRGIVSHPDVRLAYVTGRHHELVLQAIDEYSLPLPDYVIGDVGTSIYEINAKEWKLVNSWHEHISSDWQGYNRSTLAGLLEGIDGLVLQEEEKQNLYKLSYYVPEDIDTEQLFSVVRECFCRHDIKFNLVWSIDELKHTGLLDVLPESASKLHAIEFLVEQENFTLNNTVFCGDSGNDLPVLTSHIQSTLVANASDEVRQQAISMAGKAGFQDKLYIAEGKLPGLNGNYSAGIIEGIIHYLPTVGQRLATKKR